MGIFAKILRPQQPGPSTPPSYISKPRVVGNGKPMSKENFDPKKGTKSDAKLKSSKNKKFWKRKQNKDKEQAPKLSLFLQQENESDGSPSVATASMTASHTTGSRYSLSSKTLSTVSSKPHSPLHIEPPQSKIGDAENILSASAVTQKKDLKTRSSHIQEPDDQVQKNADLTKRSKGNVEIKKSLESHVTRKKKNEHLSSSKTLKKNKQAAPLRSDERPLTPHPNKLEVATKTSKETGRKPSTVKLVEDVNKVPDSEHSYSSFRSSDVVFDALIDDDTDNLELMSTGSIDSFLGGDELDDVEKFAFQITNMESLSLKSLSNSKSLSKQKVDPVSIVKKGISPSQSPNRDVAVIGSSHSTGATFVRDVVSLEDLIGEVEKDMMELDSIFHSDDSRDQDFNPNRNAPAMSRHKSGWIPNGALRDDASTSTMSFCSDEFAEDDNVYREKLPACNFSASFEITTIVEEENESDVDPLDAALKRGERLSMDAGTGVTTLSKVSDNGNLSMDYKSNEGEEFSRNGSIHADSDLSYSKSGFGGHNSIEEDSDLSECKSSRRYGQGSVHTDSDLSDSFASSGESNSQSRVSSLEKSLEKSSKEGKPRSPVTRRRISKTISWKAEHEVRTYEQPFRSLNLEMAVEMVRSYDPKYVRSPTQQKQILTRSNAQRPLKSILKKSKSWKESDSSDESIQSNSSTLSSNATSESVQYMVGKLKREAARRRRKIKRCRNNSL